MIPFRLSSTAKRATLLVVLLGALGVVAGLAFAKSGPPPPMISSGPANPTSSTSASFSFTDSQSKVTFVCSLDGASYTACTSPRSYSGLPEGTHTFSVEAKDPSGNTSSATSYSWRIDRTPPSIAVSFPAEGSVSNATGWNLGCSRGVGVCGTATDAGGVALVVVSIKQNATGQYWNGSSYSSTDEAWHLTSLSSGSTAASWFYGLSRPAPDGRYTLHVWAVDYAGNVAPSPAASVFTIDTAPPPAPAITSKPSNPTNQTSATFNFSDSESGVAYVCKLDSGSYSSCASPKTYGGLSQSSHTFSVEAKDPAGNTSTSTSYTWVIDTTPPPGPTITGHPTNPTTSDSATFTFTDKEAGVSFQCQLDNATTWQTCSSPRTYNSLNNGSHTFRVRAIDAAGNVSSSQTFSWQIQSTTGMPFTISGSVPNPLYPGMAAQAIPMTVANPNNVTIYVTNLGAAVQSTGSPGCAGSWFQVGAANIPSAGISVPANGSVTVPPANDAALRMTESGTNQDACKGAALSLSYTGSAHS